MQNKNNKIVEDIVEEVRKREVVYQRELQVYLEDKYPHWDVYNKLRELENITLKAKVYRGRKWYWLAEKDWSEIKQTVNTVANYFDTYEKHPRKYVYQDIHYADYAEFLVERALIKAGYVVVAKDAYYFNGKIYIRPGPGRPADLDFIAYVPEKDVFFGVEVKNKLRYPKQEEIDLFLDICQTLEIRPLLVTRMAHEMYIKKVIGKDGRVVVFKQLLLQPPFPEDVFEALRNKRGFPIAVYTKVPDFLVKRFTRIKDTL